jgi:hypothetical protein
MLRQSVDYVCIFGRVLVWNHYTCATLFRHGKQSISQNKDRSVANVDINFNVILTETLPYF